MVVADADEGCTDVDHYPGTRTAPHSQRLPRQGLNVKLVISDNGRGFSREEQVAKDARLGGMGLKGMEERVQMLGGMLRIASREGLGTKIDVVVPVVQTIAG